MSTLKIEKIRKDWELHQKFLLKDSSIRDEEWTHNRKRALRFIGNEEVRLQKKYRPRREDYVSEWERDAA